MLNARVTDDPGELQRLSTEWDALAQTSGFIDIYATSGFARAWWKVYGEGRALRLVLVTEAVSGKLRLVAPLYVSREQPSILKLIGNFRADYNNIVCRAGDDESVTRFVTFLHEVPEWSLLSIENVPDNSTLMTHFATACATNASPQSKLGAWLAVHRPLAFRHTVYNHPRINATRLQELKGLLEERNYRKHTNWFARQGALEYAVLTDSASIRARLDEFMDLHVKEWTARAGRSLFLDRENRVFYRTLIDELDDYRTIILHMLTLNGRMIAGHFGFEWNQRVYYYKPCYEPEFSQHSPGRVLLAHIIRDAVQRGLDEVDMLYGSEPYKMQFASDVRPTAALVLHRSRRHAFARRMADRRKPAPDLAKAP